MRICVGPKRKLYNAHRDLLASSCQFWKRKINPSRILTLNPSVTYVSNYEPTTFEFFITWLYRRTLPQLHSSDESRAKSQVSQYIALYLMAESWEVRDLQNLIIDTIKARKTCDMGWFPVEPIKDIYKATAQGSKLRHFLVDYFLFKSSKWDLVKRHEELEEQLMFGNLVFVLECYEGLYSMAYKSKMKDRDPLKQGMCEYHVHEQGKGCGHATL